LQKLKERERERERCPSFIYLQMPWSPKNLPKGYCGECSTKKLKDKETNINMIKPVRAAPSKLLIIFLKKKIIYIYI
jgi:hypothetical protein